MKRPAVFLLLFFIIGILVNIYYSEYIVLFTIGILVFFCILYSKTRADIFFLLPFFFMLGFVLTDDSSDYTNAEIEKAYETSQRMTVFATVTDIDGNIRIGETEKIYTEDKFYDDRIKISFYCQDSVQIGNRVKMTGYLEKPQRYKNQGVFNYEKYLKIKGIEYLFDSDKIFITGENHNFNYYINRYKNRFISVYDKILPQKYAGTMKAVLTGYKEDIDEGINDLYSKAGINHIIAISGLHIGILGAVLMFLLRRLGKTGNVITLLFIAFYCIFTGLSPSAVRAGIMLGLVILGKMLGRRADLLNNVVLAMLIILIYNPLNIFSLSFQLSFGAVLGLAIIMKPLASLIDNNLFKNYFLVSIAVSLVVKPLCLYYFHTITFGDFLINPIVVYLLSVLIVFGLISGISGLFSLNLGVFFSGITYGILKIYEKLTSFVVEKGTFFQDIHIDIYILVFYYILLFSAIYFISNRGNIRKRQIYFVSCLVIISSALIVYEPLSVTFLDVGQGDSAVIKTKKFCYLIDGGGEKQIAHNDTGTKALLPYFESKNIKKLDGVFISHIDTDHANGIIEIMDSIKIDKIYISYRDNEKKVYEELVSKAKEKDIPVCVLIKGSIVPVDKNTYFKCLSPTSSKQYMGNNSSMVLKLCHKEKSFLFTGDIEKKAEMGLINEDINSDVLKVAHHGSDTSTYSPFLSRVSPEIAVISYGRDNEYGVPGERVIRDLKKNKIKIYETAKSGSITCRVIGSKIYVIENGDY